MPRLRQNERQQAVTLLLQGAIQADVARRLVVNQCTIHRLWRRLRENGTTADRPRSGRPRVTTPADDRHIRLQHLRDRFRTADETALQTAGVHNPRISAKTVTNSLRKDGIKAYRPYKGLPLTKRRRDIRVAWLHRHRPNVYGVRRWRNVLFSDESRFTLFRADGRKRVYRRKGNDMLTHV